MQALAESLSLKGIFFSMNFFETTEKNIIFMLLFGSSISMVLLDKIECDGNEKNSNWQLTSIYVSWLIKLQIFDPVILKNPFFHEKPSSILWFYKSVVYRCLVENFNRSPKNKSNQ